MNEIKNTEHLNKKDKENLQDFFEKYSLAWHIAKEFERLQDKTRLEQQAEKAKEKLAEISTSVDVVAEYNKPKSTSVIRTLKTSIFEVSDMIRVFTKPVGHFVNIYDGFVEYKKTGDTIKVVTKIGSNIASGSIMIAGGGGLCLVQGSSCCWCCFICIFNSYWRGYCWDCGICSGYWDFVLDFR